MYQFKYMCYKYLKIFFIDLHRFKKKSDLLNKYVKMAPISLIRDKFRFKTNANILYKVV